ncbi:MAG: carboxypeptidase-like regulatory domain-containing protein [Bacteroidales bacterium]|nr:MAG: carboxypeptidase-like regulatory domain-containing protein [Bacteroidales bacterium]
MKKNFLLFVLLLLTCSLLSIAQQQEYFRGQIFDSKTLQPIPFATVTSSDKNFGVITNENGSFVLPKTSIDTNLNILIRCVGYEHKTIKISEFNSYEVNVFHINPKEYLIEEVKVSGKRLEGKSPKEIVSIAVNCIEKNYPQNPFLLSGYYRDYLKINTNYINLFEAIVDLEDKGFNTNDIDNTKIRMNYGGFNNSFTIDFTKVVDYGKNKVIPYGSTKYTGGNEFFFLLQHNPIRNYKEKSFDFINEIQYDFLANHKFKNLGIEYIDDSPCYKIEIKYVKPGTDELKWVNERTIKGDKNFMSYKAKGYIYIQAETYKIFRLNYQVYNSGKSSDVKLWELNMEYRDHNGLPYLNYISFNNLVEMPEWDDKGYFYLKSTEVDKQNKTLNLIFNNKVNPNSVSKFKNYRLEYDGNRLKIDNITLADSCVSLAIQNFDELLGSFEMHYSSRLKVNVKNIEDCYGNKVNDLKSIVAYQYREFFVNDVKTDFQPIKIDQCIDQVRPMIYYTKKNGKIPSGTFFNSPLIDKNDL